MPNTRNKIAAAVAAAALFAACTSANSGARASEGATTSASSPKATTAPDPAIGAADRGRISGDTTAKTWVIIASDFQCPFCRQWHSETYRPFLDEYVRTGKVRVAYINFPLGQHRNAVPTAQAAMCASAQGKFWQYHDALFDSQDRWAPMPDPRPVLDSIARTVGARMPEWAKCVDSGAMLPLIFADRDRGLSAGVRSTPSFLVGDKVITGAQPLSAMRPVIDSAIARNGSAASR
jgi:protein-disulfide isomerase